jgi:signal transduction histidine kinase
VLANIMMAVALGYQHYLAYTDYAIYKEEYDKKKQLSDCNSNKSNPKKKSVGTCEASDSNGSASRDLRDRLEIARCKLNASLFMTIMFAVFPLLYYLRWFDCFDDDVFIVALYIGLFLSKALFVLILSEAHISILDLSKILLFEETKKVEENRVMMLRYVFHEVRVPLNSVSLGLELLSDSASLSSEDKETLGLMKEATGFISETLNDVLSLQKIGEGKLDVEHKAFRPGSVMKAAIDNYK